MHLLRKQPSFGPRHSGSTPTPFYNDYYFNIAYTRHTTFIDFKECQYLLFIFELQKRVKLHLIYNKRM